VVLSATPSLRICFGRIERHRVTHLKVVRRSSSAHQRSAIGNTICPRARIQSGGQRSTRVRRAHQGPPHVTVQEKFGMSKGMPFRAPRRPATCAWIPSAGRCRPTTAAVDEGQGGRPARSRSSLPRALHPARYYGVPESTRGSLRPGSTVRRPDGPAPPKTTVEGRKKTLSTAREKITPRRSRTRILGTPRAKHRLRAGRTATWARRWRLLIPKKAQPTEGAGRVPQDREIAKFKASGAARNPVDFPVSAFGKFEKSRGRDGHGEAGAEKAA